jgi:hypothetical protein
MNGYVEAGYVVILGTLGTYGVTLLARERAARRRVGAASIEASTAAGAGATAKADILAPPGDASAVKHGAVEEAGPGSTS